MFKKIKFHKGWLLMVIGSSLLPSRPTFRNEQKISETIIQGFERYKESSKISDLYYLANSTLSRIVWFLMMVSILLFFFTLFAKKITTYNTVVRIAAPLFFAIYQILIIHETISTTNIMFNPVWFVINNTAFYFSTFILYYSLWKHYKNPTQSVVARKK